MNSTIYMDRSGPVASGGKNGLYCSRDDAVESLAESLYLSYANGNGVATRAIDAALAGCAEKLLQQAVDAEVERYLETMRQRPELAGARPIVRNGLHPARVLTTNVGPLTLRLPKLRGRVGAQPAYDSALVPRYQRRAMPVAPGAQWRFLQALAKQDWHALFFEVLGDGGFDTPAMRECGWRWPNGEGLALLASPALNAGKWAELAVKVFSAPQNLQSTGTADHGTGGLITVAACEQGAPWRLIACAAERQVSRDVWMKTARTLSNAGLSVIAGSDGDRLRTPDPQWAQHRRVV